jgi:hypothetical protein
MELAREVVCLVYLVYWMGKELKDRYLKFTLEHWGKRCFILTPPCPCWRVWKAERAPDPIILTQKKLNRRILSPDDKCSDQKNKRP